MNWDITIYGPGQIKTVDGGSEVLDGILASTYEVKGVGGFLRITGLAGTQARPFEFILGPAFAGYVVIELHEEWHAASQRPSSRR